jgi:hypothetical protein
MGSGPCLMRGTASRLSKVYAESDLHLLWTADGAVYVIEEVERALRRAATETRLQAICRAPDLEAASRALGGRTT